MLKRLMIAAASLAAVGAAPAQELVTAYVVAQVPEGTGTVYITGNSPVLGPWRPAGAAMYQDGARRIYALQAREGFVFEYKFTLGSWETESLGQNGRPPTENYRLVVGDQAVVQHVITGFRGVPTPASGS